MGRTGQWSSRRETNRGDARGRYLSCIFRLVAVSRARQVAAREVFRSLGPETAGRKADRTGQFAVTGPKAGRRINVCTYVVSSHPARVNIGLSVIAATLNFLHGQTLPPARSSLFAKPWMRHAP